MTRLLQKLEFAECNFTAKGAYERRDQGKLSILAAYHGAGLAGVLCLCVEPVNAGQVLYLEAASFVPGRFTARFEPFLLDLARVRGCLGVMFESSRPVERLRPGIEVVRRVCLKRIGPGQVET